MNYNNIFYYYLVCRTKNELVSKVFSVIIVVLQVDRVGYLYVSVVDVTHADMSELMTGVTEQ